MQNNFQFSIFNFQLSIINGCSERYEKMNNSILRIKNSKLLGV
jgi:hypothetical protein